MPFDPHEDPLLRRRRQPSRRSWQLPTRRRFGSSSRRRTALAGGQLSQNGVRLSISTLLGKVGSHNAATAIWPSRPKLRSANIKASRARTTHIAASSRAPPVAACAVQLRPTTLGLRLRDLCAQDERRRSLFQHLQIHLQTTPLRPGNLSDQGFRPNLPTDGIPGVHPSKTPQTPVTGLQLISADTTKPQPKRSKRSEQGLCETCRRGESNPTYTRPLERRACRRLTRSTWSQAHDSISGTHTITGTHIHATPSDHAARSGPSRVLDISSKRL